MVFIPFSQTSSLWPSSLGTFKNFSLYLFIFSASIFGFVLSLCSWQTFTFGVQILQPRENFLQDHFYYFLVLILQLLFSGLRISPRSYGKNIYLTFLINFHCILMGCIFCLGFFICLTYLIFIFQRYTLGHLTGISSK